MRLNGTDHQPEQRRQGIRRLYTVLSWLCTQITSRDQCSYQGEQDQARKDDTVTIFSQSEPPEDKGDLPEVRPFAHRRLNFSTGFSSPGTVPPAQELTLPGGVRAELTGVNGQSDSAR